jgi:hypothetical protein
LPDLDICSLKTEARKFAGSPSHTEIKKSYGVSDGKAVGTNVEAAFLDHLLAKSLAGGNAPSELDIPGAKCRY